MVKVNPNRASGLGLDLQPKSPLGEWPDTDKASEDLVWVQFLAW
jgi:hypothetical protein